MRWPFKKRWIDLNCAYEGIEDKLKILMQEDRYSVKTLKDGRQVFSFPSVMVRMTCSPNGALAAEHSNVCIENGYPDIQMANARLDELLKQMKAKAVIWAEKERNAHH